MSKNVTKHYLRVRKFMKGVKQPTPAEYTVPTEEQRILRARLIMEEALETIKDGLGITVKKQNHDLSFWMLEFVVLEGSQYDPVALIDGVMDLHVVATGALIDAGIPDKKFQKEVDRNNILKIKTGSTDPETGKFVKAKDHPAPKIAELFLQYCGEE